MTIKNNHYTFRIKWGKKYIAPDKFYKVAYYRKKDIASVIKEIEEEYPRYKNKVTPFQMTLQISYD